MQPNTAQLREQARQAAVPTQQLRTQAFWLDEAAQRRAAADVLLDQHHPNVIVSRALWDGACALIGRAQDLENKALKGGALLHVSVPAAIQAAKAVNEAHWMSVRAKVRA